MCRQKRQEDQNKYSLLHQTGLNSPEWFLTNVLSSVRKCLPYTPLSSSLLFSKTSHLSPSGVVLWLLPIWRPTKKKKNLFLVNLMAKLIPQDIHQALALSSQESRHKHILKFLLRTSDSFVYVFHSNFKNVTSRHPGTFQWRSCPVCFSYFFKINRYNIDIY